MQRILQKRLPLFIDISVANIPIVTSSDTTVIQINGQLSIPLTEYSQNLTQQFSPYLKECDFLLRQSGNELPQISKFLLVGRRQMIRLRMDEQRIASERAIRLVSNSITLGQPSEMRGRKREGGREKGGTLLCLIHDSCFSDTYILTYIQTHTHTNIHTPISLFKSFIPHPDIGVVRVDQYD